eukprot:1264297-Pyramimonas_sp.AAC.1
MSLRHGSVPALSSLSFCLSVRVVLHITVRSSPDSNSLSVAPSEHSGGGGRGTAGYVMCRAKWSAGGAWSEVLAAAAGA